jgi:AraC-like DNA-binding protein
MPLCDRNLPKCDKFGRILNVHGGLLNDSVRFKMPLKLGSHHYFDVGEREIGLGLYLTSVGWGVRAAGEHYPAPVHPKEYDLTWTRGRTLTDTALVFISTGKGEFETHAEKSDWNAGQAVLLPPGLWHRYRPAHDVGWTEYWLTLSGEFISRYWQQWEEWMPAKPLAVRAPITFRRGFEKFISTSMQESKSRPGSLGAWQLSHVAASLDLLGRFVAEHLGDVAVPVSHDGLDQALRYIRHHSHRPLTVEEIAASVGMARRTLERRFAEVVGRSPRQELEWMRVQRARKLLTDSRRPIKEISFECGYIEQRSLIRACRRLLGMTPSEIRNQAPPSASAGEFITGSNSTH